MKLPTSWVDNALTLRSACRQRRSAVRVAAGWGDPIEWSKGKIVKASQAAIGLQRVLIDVGDISKGYTASGQFVQLKVGESKPAFYAIASAPGGDGVVEFLVKNQGDTAEVLCRSGAGDEVDVSPVMGNGFPISKTPPDPFKSVIIFATGTGIAPIKALIESGQLQAQQRDEVRLYYGTFNPESTAYGNLIDEWRTNSGVDTVNVYSGYKDGYVQDIFAKDPRKLDGSTTCAVVCGQKEMCDAARSLLTERGVSLDNILTNY